MKTEQDRAQRTDELYHLTQEEEVWEQEEHTEVVYETAVDIRHEEQHQRERSELRGEISVTDSSKTREIKQKVLPEPRQNIVSVHERESVVTTLREKPAEGKTEVFIRKVESPTGRLSDERRDSVSVRQQTETKRREMSITTESREIKREKTSAAQEIEPLRDVPEADQSQPELEAEGASYDEDILSGLSDESRAAETTPSDELERRKKERTAVISHSVKQEKVQSERTFEAEITSKTKPKESVTDIKPKKPKVIQNEAEFQPAAAEREAQPKEIPPEREHTDKEADRLSVASVPQKKTRISTARGTERKL